METSELPRLLYLADVPVESSYHGSALLYRLLQDYPVDRLLVIEPSAGRSQFSRRLPDARYEQVSIRGARLIRTRLAALYSSVQFICSSVGMKKIDALLGSFQPEAVLTVAHACLWRTAAAFANRRQLPLHLICHDEITQMVPHLPALKGWVEQAFGDVYRASASRFCVSPYMRDDYRARFGVDAQVLYPSRAADVPKYQVPPDHLASLPHGLRVAFAGTINSPGHARLLQDLASCLQSLGGKLLLYGPITEEISRQVGLALPNVELRGLLPSNVLIQTLRTEANLLYVPMSFEPQDRLAMKTNFPSKLADYTAVGLPLLVQGPSDSSAAMWALENPGVAEVVTESSGEALAQSLTKFAGDSARRLALGAKSLEVGHRFFAHDRARQMFQGGLRQGAKLAQKSVP